MSLLLAQAAVNDANIHFDKLYSYRIPAELAGRVFPGSMVLVPFGRGSKARMAVVLAVGEVDESDAPKGLKTLYDAAPEDARLTPDLLELVRFLKERTFCTWFEAVKAVIPYGAQYRPAVVDGRHVMQGRLTRSTERLYTLAGALPESQSPARANWPLSPPCKRPADRAAARRGRYFPGNAGRPCQKGRADRRRAGQGHRPVCGHPV